MRDPIGLAVAFQRGAPFAPAHIDLDARFGHAFQLQHEPLRAVLKREADVVFLTGGINQQFVIGRPGINDRRELAGKKIGVLREMEPAVASFYVLCPIPGTEQYDEFLAANWITEPNLDRFDGTRPTWRHPNLPPKEWDLPVPKFVKDIR